MKPLYAEKAARVPKREGWHVMVVFCGYLNETEIMELRTIVKQAVSLFSPFTLKADRIVLEPNIL